MEKSIEQSLRDYDVFLETGGEFHSQKEFEEWLDGAEQDSTEQQCYELDEEEYWRGYEESCHWYEKQKWLEYTLTPYEEEIFAKQLTGELPIKNGNKLSIVNELYLSGFHISEEFSTKYPEAYSIYKQFSNML